MIQSGPQRSPGPRDGNTVDHLNLLQLRLLNCQADLAQGDQMFMSMRDALLPAA